MPTFVLLVAAALCSPAFGQGFDGSIVGGLSSGFSDGISSGFQSSFVQTSRPLGPGQINSLSRAIQTFC